MNRRRGETLLERLPFVTALVTGVVLLVVLLARGSPQGAHAGDRLVELASPVLSDAGLRQLRSEFNELEAAGKALERSGIPRLASLSGQSTDVFVGELAYTAPEVANGLARLPAITDQADRIISNLEGRQHQFESAASLPGGGFTLQQAMGAMLATASGLVLAGLIGWARPRRWFAGTLGAVGLVLLIVPVAAGYPQKTSDTDALFDSLRPFSIEKVRDRQDALATVRGLLDGLTNRAVPHAARLAGTSPAAVAAELAAADHRLAPTNLARVASIVDHFAFLVDFSAQIQPLLVDATRMPARAITWLALLPGSALVGTTTAALLPRRERHDQVTTS